MKTAQPAPTLTAAERRAAKIAAWEERRRQDGKPTDGSASGYTLIGGGRPASPRGGYTIVNEPQPASEIEVIHVRQA